MAIHKKSKRKLLSICIATLLAIGFGATNCSEDGGYYGAEPPVSSDPSKPVIFTDFSPKKGAVRTLVFIEGSNFGTDASKIEVYMGGISAPVIGTSGMKICVMTPRRSDRGDVVVRIKDKEGKVIKEHQFDDLFWLQSALQVNTLTGKVDPQTNSSSIIIWIV